MHGACSEYICKAPDLFYCVPSAVFLEFCCYLLFVLTESSSFAEKKQTEHKHEAPKKKYTANPPVLKNSGSIRKDVRLEIEQALVVKLENMGVKPVSSVS